VLLKSSAQLLHNAVLPPNAYGADNISWIGQKFFFLFISRMGSYFRLILKDTRKNRWLIHQKKKKNFVFLLNRQPIYYIDYYVLYRIIPLAHIDSTQLLSATTMPKCLCILYNIPLFPQNLYGSARVCTKSVDLVFLLHNAVFLFYFLKKGRINDRLGYCSPVSSTKRPFKL
jgi:hypothetical protein